ncbi:MAG TPA: hypothetical protein VGR16_10595 [Thermomicrobiales bacterium]|nr:hypothetical protein [Thermomicrobiales bacterium]
MSNASDRRRAKSRRPILDMALRRVKPGSGSSVAFLSTRTWSDPLTPLDLHRLRTPFVIVDGVATALYMPQRVMLDLDLLVIPADEPQLAEEMRQAGGIHQGTLTVGGSSWQFPAGSRLDVLAPAEPWVEAAVSSPNRAPTGLPVIALPYLVLMKLASGRAQDIADLSRMLGQADPSLRASVREAVATFRPEDMEDLESLIILGDLELQEP